MMLPKVPASMAEKAAGNGAPVWPRARDVLLFAAVLFLADRLGLLFAPAPAHVSAVWPSAGVTLAAALRLGRGAGAVIWVVAFLVGGVFSLAAQGDWRAAAGIEAVTVTGSTLRAVLGAALLRRFGGPQPSLTRARTVAALVLGAGMAACTVAATLGVAVRALAGRVPAGEMASTWLTWWLGDTAGVVIGGALLLLLLEPGPRAQRRRSRTEAASLAALVLLVAVTGASDTLGAEASRAVFVLLVPLVIWSAFRFSPFVTALVTTTLSVVVIGSVARRLGPLAWLDPGTHLQVLQVFLIVLAATGLILAAAVAEAREAERRLRDTTELLRAVTEGTPDVVFVKDREGRYLLINSAGARYMERPVAEVLGRKDADLFEGDILRQIETYDRLLLETGVTRTDEYNEVKGGTRRTFLATKGVLRDAQGEVAGLFGISREITNRKLERMLLNGILEGSHDLVSAVDLDFRYVAFNQALRDEFRKGFGQDLVPGARLSDLLAEHPEALAQRLSLLGRTFKGEEARTTWTMGPPSPEARWFDVVASPLRDETGHVIGGALIGRDITKAREAETALKASQSRFRAVSLQAPVGIFETDLSGCCTFVNEAWSGLSGRGETEALGVAWNASVHPEDLARVVFAWDDMVERNRSFRQEYRFLHEDGHVVWVTGAAEPLRDPRGFVLGFLGTCADVSERRQAEEDVRRTGEALAAANQELESFSYSVSHDLRAPLRGIDGFSRALEEDFGATLPEEGRRFISRIRAATRRMGLIIDDLLLLSRVARSELRRERVDLGALALEVYAGLRTAEPARDVRLAVGEGLQAQGDPRLLRLLLENLLGNAWKYTSKKPRAQVEFAAQANGGETVYYVRDDGAGFDMAYADKLFGAFSRLHNANDFPGSGIGLATVARIVHRHGGRVWGEGAPGAGATFYFTLGRSEAS